jgi:hypothetical protein
VIKEAIEFLQKNATPRIATTVINNLVHVVDQAGNVYPKNPPLPALIELTTLSGLAGLITSGLDQKAAADFKTICYLHVEDHETVSLVDRVPDAYGQRRTWATATAVVNQPIQFNRYYEPDEFVIGLLAGFLDTPDLTSLLKIVGNLAAENVATSTDDGVSQTVAVRKGVLKASVELPPRVTLTPYRTFSEAQQPSSSFLFRVKNMGADRVPQCGLFEADGGAWKATAMKNIQRALATMTTVEIVA